MIEIKYTHKVQVFKVKKLYINIRFILTGLLSSNLFFFFFICNCFLSSLFNGRLVCAPFLNLLCQINRIIYNISGLLKPKTSTELKQNETQMYTIEDFVVKAEIDHINLRPLVEFCENTRLAPKLHGFSMRYSQQLFEEQNKKPAVNQKSSFEKFINNISKKPDDTAVEETNEDAKTTTQVNIIYLYKN